MEPCFQFCSISFYILDLNNNCEKKTSLNIFYQGEFKKMLRLAKRRRIEMYDYFYSHIFSIATFWMTAFMSVPIFDIKQTIFNALDVVGYLLLPSIFLFFSIPGYFFFKICFEFVYYILYCTLYTILLF